MLSCVTLYFVCYSHYVFVCFFFLMMRRPPRSTRTDTLFPYPTLFRSFHRLVPARQLGCGRHFFASGLDQVTFTLRGAQGGVAAGGGDPQTVHRSARAGRNQTANDDVFLQAIERIDLALNRSEERRVGKGCVRTCRSLW